MSSRLARIVGAVVGREPVTLDSVLVRMRAQGWHPEATLLAVTAAAGRVSQADLEFLAAELTKAETALKVKP